MVRLLQLPTELLFRIFEFLDRDDFRLKLPLLTVCKLWYMHAQEVFSRDHLFTCASLRRLRSSPHKAEEIRTQLRAAVTKLDLKITVPFQGRATDLDDDLLALAYTRSQVPRIRNLRLRAISPDIPPQRACCLPSDYLHYSTLATLLTTARLTVLSLDLAPIYLIDKSSSCSANGTTHFCTAIAALLPQLHYLRLRLSRICARVLTPPRDHEGSLALREVLVNLDASYRVGCKLKSQAMCAKKCVNGGTVAGKPAGDAAEMLMGEMELQGRLLRESMAEPRLVYVGVGDTEVWMGRNH